MESFADYLAAIEDPVHRARMREVFAWVNRTFPELNHKIAWRQPMWTDHGTFIISFGLAKQHMSVAPESVAITRFAAEIAQAGYTHSKELVRMPWDRPVDYALLTKIIEFNIADKAACKTFWRMQSEH